MKYVNRFRVEPGSKVELKDIDPGFKDHHEGRVFEDRIEATSAQAALEMQQRQSR